MRDEKAICKHNFEGLACRLGRRLSLPYDPTTIARVMRTRFFSAIIQDDLPHLLKAGIVLVVVAAPQYGPSRFRQISA